MTPQRIVTESQSLSIPYQGSSRESLEKLIFVLDQVNGAVLWNGHEFEVIPLKYIAHNSRLWFYDLAVEDVYELSMHFYFPIDPRTVAKDWRGAIKAYPNETNDAWLPEHCDNDHMMDREVELRSGLVSVFQPIIDKLTISVLTATANKPSDWPIGIPWETPLVRRLKLQELITFRDTIIQCLLKEARDRPIGWYHQNPHESHLHSLLQDCITRTNGDGSTYSSVQGEIQSAITSLTTHTYERTWERKARLRPKVASQIAAVTLVVDGSANVVDLTNKFSTVMGSLTYTVMNSDTAVVTAVVDTSMLTLTPLKAGTATITIRATGVEDLYIEQTFLVSVVADQG